MIPKIPKILLIIFLVIFILQMLALLILLIAPLFVQAKGALDPTCWAEETCKEVSGIWEEEKADCGEGWGRCYPATAPIPLQIKLQGQEKVTDIAQYIALLYQYTVGVGAVLAVVMILWGGVVYLTAGGLPDKISQAKEYISNAIIGLVLLYTSYLLLQTLNPDLVKLRMPRVYMIRPLALGARFCEDMGPEGGLYKLFGGFAEAEEGALPTSFTLGPGDLKCNKQYYWAKGGEQKCWGKRCPPGSENEKLFCVSSETPTPEKQFECKKADAAVEIQYSGGAWVDDAWLYLVAQKQDGSLSALMLDRTNVPEEKKQIGNQSFFFSPAENLGYYAQIKGFKGFLIVVEIDDPGGNDDFYALGKSLNQPFSFTAIKTGSVEIGTFLLLSLTEEVTQGKSYTDADLFISDPSFFQINETNLIQTSDFLTTLSYQLNRENFPTR